MLFNSGQFLLFFPIVVAFYYLIPKKVRYIWLLLSSYFFYMCWNVKYSLLLLFSTVITYACGCIFERLGDNQDNENIIRKKKWIVAGGVTVNLLVLGIFKYLNFFVEIITKIFEKVHIAVTIPAFDILLPVGISFYTFQALGYLIDVYRGEIKAEKNFLRYALFVSFFPQLVAGPIERSQNLLTQLKEPKKADFESMRDGILLMLWGYFLKIVIADRIALYVDTVYMSVTKNGADTPYPGWYLIVATILFAFQIYCDFYGYSTIAMGAAKVLQIKLMENFNAPYFSRSVSEFWNRWHISLSSWFKDYLYIPLGGNRKGKLRKYYNLMVVFLVSGLWHGAGITFVIWGGLNGLYQVLGDVLKPVRNKLKMILKLSDDSFANRFVQGLVTFGLIDFAWIFFRANYLSDAIVIVKQIFTANNPWIFWTGELYECGLSQKNFSLLIICLVILCVADGLKYVGISVRNFWMKQDYWFRWLFFSGTIVFILVFGIWGSAYDAASFIYFQF